MRELDVLVGACPDLPRQSGAPRVGQPRPGARESLHVEADEITETRDGRVFARLFVTGRGRASGVDTQIHGWTVLWFGNGMITRQVFLDRDEALEAAGLSE